MGALEWEWGMLGSQMCAHARGCASAQSLHTCVCLCVPALCMGTQSRQSAGVQVCTLRPRCTCVPAPCTCACICPVHTCAHRFAPSMHTSVSLSTWSCDMGSVRQIRVCLIHARVYTCPGSAHVCAHSFARCMHMHVCTCARVSAPCMCVRPRSSSVHVHVHVCVRSVCVCLVHAHECRRVCLTHVCTHVLDPRVSALCMCVTLTPDPHTCVFVGVCTGSVHVCANVHARSGVSGHVCLTATRVCACAYPLQAQPCV